MPVDVAIYALRGNNRSQRLAHMAHAGVLRAGDTADLRSDGDYRGPDTPVALFYGYEKNLPRVMEDYREAGKRAVYIDLGYFGRRMGGRWEGYHKVAVNDRHPTAYFQKARHDMRRARKFGLSPKPWSKGKHVLIAGMSDRAAQACGLNPAEWEREAIKEIAKHTDRPIIYRPKPSWTAARPIPGASFSPKAEPLERVLRNCHAVVTHHSNVAVEALLMGVPAFAFEGVAKPMGLQDLSRIEDPMRPDGRRQWINDIAYCQWNGAELRSGEMWKHLKGEGLIP